MLEVRVDDFHRLNTNDRVARLREVGMDSFLALKQHQLPNGLHTASLGRFDDMHFNDMVWVKDHARAMRHALDSHFIAAFPELQADARDMYLNAARGMLLTQGQPEQMERFTHRPHPSLEAAGYHEIDDTQAPAIKFTSNGEIFYDWGHDQPDNWGVLLQVLGRGIEQGLPVLDRIRRNPDDESYLYPGKVLDRITNYMVNYQTERARCRSIWEHRKGHSSYSTRRLVLAGLEQMEAIWSLIVKDSQTQGYSLETSIDQLSEARRKLNWQVTEHFPADYTDEDGHSDANDMASMVVLNDIDNLPKQEILSIASRSHELENEIGFYRYIGDTWKVGQTEAMWTMGKPIMARYHFREALRYYAHGKTRDGHRALNHGFDKIHDITDIIHSVGYIPELYEDEDGDGVYHPNNNELAWTHGYVIEAVSAGIIASLKGSEFFTKPLTVN